MNDSLKSQDMEILSRIAGYQCITIWQLAASLHRNIRSLRRRLRKFEKQGWIRIDPLVFRAKRGRPEGLISLDKKGITFLKREGIVKKNTPPEQVSGENAKHLEHHILGNDFRAQIDLIGHVVSDINVRFFSPGSLGLNQNKNDQFDIQEKFQHFDPLGEAISFIPDAVFTLKDSAKNKMLLFYLEVDRGTEALVSRKYSHRDLKQKILNYQLLYYTDHYQRYEKIWNCSFRGFRLLILTHSEPRFLTLGRFIRKMKATRFIYLTHQELLLTQGVWGKIWYEGGNIHDNPVSILGNKLPTLAPKPRDLI